MPPSVPLRSLTLTTRPSLPMCGDGCHPDGIMPLCFDRAVASHPHITRVPALAAQPSVTSPSARTKVSLNLLISRESKARPNAGVNKTRGAFLSLESYFLFVTLLETASKSSFDASHAHRFCVSCFHFPNMFIKKCSQGNSPCGRNFCFGGRIPELEVFLPAGCES